jgi:hypothetical protein
MFLESHHLTYEGVYHVCCHPVCDTEKISKFVNQYLGNTTSVASRNMPPATLSILQTYEEADARYNVSGVVNNRV